MVLHVGSPGFRTNIYDGCAKGVKFVLIKRLLCGPQAGLPLVLGKKTRFLLRPNSARNVFFKQKTTHL